MISQYSNKKHHLSLNKPDVDIRNVGHIDPFFLKIPGTLNHLLF